MVYTIKTGDSKPVFHNLRKITFARCQYLKQKIKQLMSVNAVWENQLACPVASRTVIALKESSLLMCVNYRDMNKQNENNLFLLLWIDQVWMNISKAKYFVLLN